MENKCSIRKQIIEKENKELAEAEPKETIDVKEILATDKWLRELDNQSFGFALTNEVIEEEVVRVGKRGISKLVDAIMDLAGVGSLGDEDD